MALLVKNLPANAGDIRDMDLIPGSERFPGEGNGNPLQCSCLENPMDGGAWWATVHGVAKSRTQLSDFTHSQALVNKTERRDIKVKYIKFLLTWEKPV